jgi:hypothetical protein
MSLKLATSINQLYEALSYRGHIQKHGLIYVFGKTGRYPNAIFCRSGIDKYSFLILKNNKSIHPSAWNTLPDDPSKGRENFLYLVGDAKREGVYKTHETDINASQFMQNIINKHGLNAAVVFIHFPELQQAETENKVKVGSFELIYNEEKEHTQIEPIVLETEAILKKFGFGKLCYGKLFSTPTIRAGQTLADYTDNTDSVRISNKAKKSNEAIRIMIHELGHRLWYRFLSDKQKQEITDKFYEVQKNSDFKISLGDKFVDEKGKIIVVSDYVSGRQGKMQKFVFKYDAMEKSPRFSAAKGYFRRLTPIGKKYEYDPFDVTEYAKTNEKEFFSEVFSFALTQKNKVLLDFIKRYK